jgi:hypothetical protein
MRATVRAFCIIAIIAIVAIAGAAGAAAVDKARIAAVDKAADAFLALAKDAYKTGQPPRESDPAVKPLLDAVFDTSGVTGSPVAFADIDKLNDWMLRAVAVGSVYVLAGTGIPDFGHLSTLDAKQQQQVIKNTAAYAPEIGRYFDAEVELEQAVINCVTAELAANPDKYRSPTTEGGVAKIRSGVKQTLTGVITTFATPGLDGAWKRARLPALMAIAGPASKFLSTEDRKELAQVARQVAGQTDDPEVKSGLEAFAKAVSA